jgi:hypothetical protein
MQRVRLASFGRQRAGDGALNGEAHTLRHSSRLAQGSPSKKLQNTTGGLLCA